MDLLNEKGERQPRFPAIIRPLLAALASPLALIFRVTPYEFVDKRSLVGVVGGVQPVTVSIESSQAVPSKSYSISVRLQGLEDELIFLGGRGPLIQHNYRDTDARTGAVSKRSYYKEMDPGDLPKYAEVVRFLM